LLALITLATEHLARLASIFDLTYAPDEAARTGAVASHGASLRVVLTNGRNPHPQRRNHLDLVAQACLPGRGLGISTDDLA
jgi:hypothetical protein